MKNIIILAILFLVCTLAWSQSTQVDSGNQPRLAPPSWQAVLIIATIAFAFGAVGVGGVVALKGIAKGAYLQGAAPGAPESFNAFFVQSARIAVVALIVIATVVLAVYDRLDKGAIGLLSGVAGYVLGGADRTRRSARSSSTSTSSTRTP